MKSVLHTGNVQSVEHLAKLAVDTVAHPERYVERLCALTVRDQWDQSTMDWESVDFARIPGRFRKSAADMFAQLHYGEVAALAGAARIEELAPEGPMRDFCRMHAADEARHVWWFSRLMEKLGCEGKVLPCTEEFMTEILASDSLDGLLVGINVLVEGMAHSLFMEGARASNRTGSLVNRVPDFASAKKVFGDWLPNYLAHDESRHIAFGTRLLSYRVRALGGPARRELERQSERWIELFLRVVRDPAMLAVSGLNSADIRDRCISNLNRRLEQSGLDVQIPAGP